MVLQRVYGSKSEAQDQLKQPILALAAGYMPFYAKKGAVVQTRRMTSDPLVQQTYSERVALFAKNESGDFLFGRYAGNYILYKYYNPQDLDVAGLKVRDFQTNVSGQGDAIINRALTHIKADVENMEAPEPFKRERGIKSPEEQMSAIGYSSQDERKEGRKGAEPVDIELQNSRHQVTYSNFLAEFGHHGLEKRTHSARRREMNKQIRKHAREGKGDNKQYKKMAKEALSYFKKEIADANRILRDMQKGGMQGAKALRVESPRGKAKKGVKRDKPEDIFLRNMRKHSKTSMGVEMRKLTRTALGNMRGYTQGVYYSMLLDASVPVHGRIGQFIMNEGPIIQFQESALNEAHISYGLDSTTNDIIMENNILNANDINFKRTQAQFFTDVKAIGNTVTINAMQSGNLAGELAKASSVYPTIDILGASTELSEYVAQQFLPSIKVSANASMKKMDKKILGQRRQRTIKGLTFWAQPYLSIYEGRVRRFGFN